MPFVERLETGLPLFKRDLTSILGHFTKVQKKLEAFIARETERAEQLLRDRLRIKDEEDQARLNVRTAQKANVNISQLLGN